MLAMRMLLILVSGGLRLYGFSSRRFCTHSIYKVCDYEGKGGPLVNFLPPAFKPDLDYLTYIIMDNTGLIVGDLIPIAIETSISICQYGAPMGGTVTWAVVLYMTSNSKEYPWSHIQAAAVGFPIIFLCDFALIIPAFIFCYMRAKKL